jgi:chromosome partitioning protein
MKTITLANHKGGCGKTTTALNLAVALAAKGARVLAVDLDFQGNLSDSMGCDLRELVQMRRTVHRLMLEPSADYSQYIETVRVDTPPALNTPTLNGLVAADLVVIPVETSRFALVGLTQLLATVHEVRQAHVPGQLVMALSTIHSARQVFDREVRAQVFDIFTEDFVFQSVIPRHVAVGEATADRKAVVEVNTASPATLAFHQLVKEVRELLGDDQEQEARKPQRITK